MPRVTEPLKGKRIVVTRAREQSAEFVRVLQSLGAEVLLLPAIDLGAPEDTGPLDRALLALDTFGWVVFTSRNAVKFVVSRFRDLGMPADRMNRLMLAPQVAVIGSATSDEAWSAGFIPQYEAEESHAEALARELADQVRGKRVLLPRSDRADARLPEALRRAGADVTEVIAYRNAAPSLDSKVLDAIRDAAVDVLTFFSPSAYRHLAGEIGVETLRRQSGKILLASIGPTTSNAIRQDALQVAIEAPSASATALAEAIGDYFRNRARMEATSQ